MIRHLFRHLLTYTLLLPLVLPVSGAPKEQSEQDASSFQEGKSPFPKNGIRFVICSEGNTELPSPLYVKVGKDYVPVTVSRHMPSPRLTPINGVINFYKEIPESAQTGKEPVEKPTLSIPVPEAYRSGTGKVLCIMQPASQKNGNIRTYFLKESDFPYGGLHIINLTPKTLEIVTDNTGRFEGNLKTQTISPSSTTQIISAKEGYVWSYVSKKDRQRVNYVLQAKAERGKEPVRIRSSVFMVGKDSSQISFVMMSSKRKDMYVLQSVQFTRDPAPAPADK